MICSTQSKRWYHFAHEEDLFHESSHTVASSTTAEQGMSLANNHRCVSACGETYVRGYHQKRLLTSGANIDAFVLGYILYTRRKCCTMFDRNDNAPIFMA